MLLDAMSSRFAVNDVLLLRGHGGKAGRHAPETARAGIGGAGAHGLCSVALGLVEHVVQRVKGDAMVPMVAGRDDAFK